MTEAEIAFADHVYAGTLDYERIVLTDLVGTGGRPFTVLTPWRTIYVNLGEGFGDPAGYTGKGGSRTGINAPGQLLIHELAHAWQFTNASHPHVYFLRAALTAAGTVRGNMSAYDYGPPDREWAEFGSEQQASIVDEWFAGSRGVRWLNRENRQVTYPPRDDREGPGANPYYPFIRDHLRQGRP